MTAGVWIYGDQVSRHASSLAAAPGDCPVVFVESLKFCRRRPYHWQKLTLIFSAMRHFAAELRSAGRTVDYFPMESDFVAGLEQFVQQRSIDLLYVMEPNDHDRSVAMPAIANKIGCRIEVTPNNQFLTTHEQFQQWAADRKSLVMESFYHAQRKRLNLLIGDDGAPAGGAWNLDKLNRVGTIPIDAHIPQPQRDTTDAMTVEVMADVQKHFAGQCFGGEPTLEQMRERFLWSVTPESALRRLRDFLVERLENFGPYEDAMTTRSWSLWHSHLSVSMNCGLLHPRQVIDEAMKYALPLLERGLLRINSVEGFVRQLIGWREFMRGIYWREMTRPGAVPYPSRNELDAHRPLPDFYWTADTDMRCMRDCVGTVIRHGYSHHIPRLMVLANFALLHGISPQRVNEWFIYAYADGYEWVTTPNVVGMALYADGGIVATKPYAAGGAYIDRMSDYCKQCRYNPRKATGPDACPFTRAYWPFINRHRKRLSANLRTRLTVRGLDRFGPEELRRRQQEADEWLDRQPVYA